MSGYPLSAYRQAGPLVFISGQLGVHAGRLVEGGFDAEAPAALTNLVGALGEAGLGPADVIKVNIFLTSMENYQAFNDIYTQTFTDPYPARTAVCVKELPAGGCVEVECVAWRSER